MNKILITGEHSYLAGALKTAFLQGDNDVTLLSVRGEDWKSVDFSGYDAVIHCAALVHQNEKKHTLEDYRAVNTELTVELAKKAKAAGVKQFVFFSTMSVYGVKSSCWKDVPIAKNQPCKPHNKYGISKLEAEQRLTPLASESFTVSIVRPPFVYGKNSPGNYGRLRRLVLRFRVIPKLPGRHSMIYIGTLCEFVRGLVEQRLGGVFTPQNLPIRNAWELAAAIADINGVKVWKTSLLNPAVRLASLVYGPISQAFGSEYYEEQDSIYDGIKLTPYTLEETVRLTEE